MIVGVGFGGGVKTGATLIAFEIAGARLPLVNRSVIVSANVSARFENVATPPTSVVDIPPWSEPAPLLATLLRLCYCRCFPGCRTVSSSRMTG